MKNEMLQANLIRVVNTVLDNCDKCTIDASTVKTAFYKQEHFCTELDVFCKEQGWTFIKENEMITFRRK